METDQRKISPFMRLFWEEQQKHLQSSQNNATYHPMNHDNDVTYETVNQFSFIKCFMYFISDVLHYIWWNRHRIVYITLVKVDIRDTSGAMNIEISVYKSSRHSMLLFINRLTFDINNIQNNLSLEFEWKPMLALLRSVNDNNIC